MSYKLLKKTHNLHYKSTSKSRLSIGRVLDSLVHNAVVLLYISKSYYVFSRKTHNNIRNWLNILEYPRVPHGRYVEFEEKVSSVKLVYTVSIPIEYLKVVNKNLLKLLNTNSFYTEHGTLTNNKNAIRDTFQKLSKLDNFTTFHDSFLCEFDFSNLGDSNHRKYINGVSINFLKLFESSIFLQFTIRPNESFNTLFHSLCISPEWSSSLVGWNDWLSILKGYKSILCVSNEDRIRRLSYSELIADLQSSMQSIVYRPLLKGVRPDLISEGSEAVIYSTENINEINRDSSIFKTIHSASGTIRDINKVKYCEMPFEDVDVFFVPIEEAGAASFTMGEVRSAIYEISMLQNYRWIYYSIRQRHHALNEIIYQLLEQRWYQFWKLFLYRKVAKIKLQNLFYKNLYVRAVHDDDLERVDAILATVDNNQKEFEKRIQTHKKDMCGKIDKLLESLTAIGEDTNVITTSYLSNIIQFMGILLGVLALLNIRDILYNTAAFFTYVYNVINL